MRALSRQLSSGPVGPTVPGAGRQINATGGLQAAAQLVTLSFIDMSGWWIVQTIVYVPALRMVRL